LHSLPIWRKVHTRPDTVRFPGGESLREAQKRAVRMIQEINTESDSGIVAVFTHADTIRLALAHFLQMPLPAYHALAAAPASISVLSLTRDATRVTGINLPPGSPLQVKPE
jgi:broad specificity phosphatase PhoE